MTRTATKPGRAKRALDATPWKELSAGSNSLSKGKKPLKTKVKGSGKCYNYNILIFNYLVVRV